MSESKSLFEGGRAATFERQWAKLAPMKDALHLLMRVALRELPSEARVLCAGVGTGAELLALADGHPGWHFMVFDPSEAMLAICHERATERGIAERCVFHHGYIDSLPAAEPFDAATSILVSQFIVDAEQRGAFFGSLGARLRAGGHLVNADLAADMGGPFYDQLWDLWRGTLEYAELPAEEVEKVTNAFGKAVAVYPPSRVAEIIEAGGFEPPTLFYQSVMIHAWHARRAPAATDL